MSLNPTSRPARAAHGFQSGRESRPHGTGHKLSKSQTTEILTTLVIMGLTGVNHNWTAAEDALLGKMLDGEAARRIGLTPLSIYLRRKKLGIPAYKPTTKPRAAKFSRLIGRGRKNKQARSTVIKRKSKTWAPTEIALLGTDADLEIAKRLGRTKAAVQKEQLRKIPAIGDKRPRIKSWGTIEVLLFDQYSDAEIAKLLRRDVTEVTALRRKLRKGTR